MKRTKILFLLMVLLTIVSCTSEETKEAKRRATYYLDEDFVLVQKKEDVASSDGTPYKVRTWVVHRVNSPYDSVYVGEISSRVLDPEPDDKSCGCGTGDYYITNELWYNKEIGDLLHFDFIRKNRFYKVHKDKLEKTGLTYAPDYTSNTVTTTVITSEPTVDNLELDRQILEVERQIMSLERELETLKNKKK